MKKIYKISGNINDLTNVGKRINCLWAVLVLLVVMVQNSHAQANFYTYSSTLGNSLETIMTPTVVTTTVGGSFDNDYNLISPANFNFQFGGTNYTQFAVSTNGWIRLGNGVPPVASGSISQIGIDGIYAFTRDANMNIPNGGNLTHGPAAGGKYVFQFVKIAGQNFPNATSYADAQIVLWGANSASPGYIEIIYGASATTPTSQFRAGIGDVAGRTMDGLNGVANSQSLSSSWLVEGRKLTFTPPPACTTPLTQPTALNFTSTTFSSIVASFTAAPSTASALVVRYPSGATPTPPTDGIFYVTNGSLGSGIVVNSAASNNFTAGNLDATTTYDFYIYSYNSNCLGAPFYNTVSPLTASRTTPTGTLSGVKTVGTGGTYTSLTAAFAAIATNGASGDIELQLIAGYPATVESFPIGNNLTSGVLGGHNLDIYPTVSGLSISASASGIIIFPGTKNVTIDGRVNKTGPMNLVISNTGIGNNYAIQFTSDASNNTIKYCSVRSANNFVSSGTIIFNNGTITGNDNNTIDHCDIRDSAGLPINAIYSFNSVPNGNDNSGNIISNNNIYNYFSPISSSCGITVSVNSKEWSVIGNRFFQEAPRVVTSINTTNSAISINNGSGHTIEDNVIGFADVSGNGVTNITGNAVISRFIGINLGLSANSSSPNSIRNNTISGISLTSTGGSYFGSAASCTIGGIIITGSSVAGASTIISGNTIGAANGNGAITLNFANTTQSYVTGIYCGASAINHPIDITDNVISSITGTSTVAAAGYAFLGIYSSNNTGNTVTVSGNTIGGNTANANAFGTNGQTTGSSVFIGIDVAAGTTPNTAIKNNNTIKNNTLFSSNTVFTGIRQSTTSSNTTNANTVSNNSIISTIAPAIVGTLSVYGFQSTGTIGTENYTNNVVEQLMVSVNTAAGTNLYGISTDLASEGTKTISNNTITNLSFTNLSAGNAIVTGLNTRRSSSIFKNKINNLTANTGISSQVLGIWADIATTMNINNNIIGNVMASQGNGSHTGPAAVGIYFGASVVNANVYFNTVYLAGSGGTNYFTEGLFSNVTTSLDLRNNIIINNATASGTGKTIAFARGSTVLSNYNSLSNNNLFYAGTPGLSRLIYFDGTNNDQTISSFKTRVSPRDLYSIAKSPLFITTDGNDSAFLHIDPSDNSGIESGGTVVSGLTTDFDGNTRNATTPDIGADEGSFTPYVLLNPNVIVTSTGGTGAPSKGYETLGDAILAINSGIIHTGTIECGVNAGYTETAPSGGFVITATGTAANPIRFVKNGVGANPILTASSSNTINSITDAVIKIIGSDYITIESLTMQENAANITTSAMTEFGVMLSYATTTDGAQHCTIKNCTIDLNASHTNSVGIYSNSCHTAVNATNVASASTIAGANSFLSIKGNTITDVNHGIIVNGPTAAADWNDGLIIGGALEDANTISAFGSNAVSLPYANLNSGLVSAIFIRNTKNYTVSYNTISSSANIIGGVTRGIYIMFPNNIITETVANSISNNTISLKNNTNNFSMEGISIDSNTASATSSITIDTNEFTATNATVASTGGMIFIRNSSTFGTMSISNNMFNNITLNMSGVVTLISNTAIAATVANINGNSIGGSFVKTAGSNGFIGIITNCAGSISNNSLTNISGVGTNFTGINSILATSQLLTIENNIISNISGIGSIYAFVGIQTSSASLGSTVNGNIINTAVAGGSSAGIYLGQSGPFNGNCLNNTISGLSANGSVIGINALNVPNGSFGGNKIYNLESSNASATVMGINSSNGIISMFNNMIGDLRNPVANIANALIGININAATACTLDHNTVYLNATSSGGLFGSSALSTFTTPNITLRNNIFVNNSAANGLGFAVAHRRNSNQISTYLNASDNNLFYSNSGIVYTDGTTTNTVGMVAYKSKVYPREIHSISANPIFLSTSGASSDFLHISPSDASGIESGGQPTAIATDYDGTIRNTNTPDIGADEGNFIGLPVQPIVVNVTSTGGTFPVKGYTSFGAALAAINGGISHTGTIVCTVNAGHTETTPAGGYLITATGTEANPISFVKGVGANPVFTASPYHNIGETHNALFKIIGSDYVTIDGFTMVENASNTTSNQATNNMTEFGVMVSLNSITDGAQNCTIKNCTIDLDKNNPYSVGIYSNSTTNSTHNTVNVIALSGSNSNLALTGNTISDVNTGIIICGATSDAGANDGLIIGGSLADANTITDFAASSMPTFNSINFGAGNGIIIKNTKNFNVSYNTLVSNGTLTTTGIRGIYVAISSMPLTGAITDHIDHNNLSLRLGSGASFQNEGIIFDNLGANTTATVTIDQNNFYNYGSTVAGATQVTFIKNNGQAANFSISGNTFTNISLNTSSATILINNTTVTYTTCAINNNAVVGTFTNAGTGAFTGFTHNTAVNGSLAVNNNNFSNITLTNGGFFNGLSLNAQQLQMQVAENNTISNITGVAGAITGISIINGLPGSRVNGNTISNLSATNSISGIFTNSVVTSSIACYNNAISGLSSSGLVAVYGINVNGGDTNTVYGNRIYNIQNTHSSGSVIGLNVSNGVVNTIYNNLVADLRTPAANNSNPLVGFNINSSGTSNIYHNTVYLNAVSTGAVFGSSAISTGIIGALNLRNNIFVNTSQNNTSGYCVAFRRNGSNLGTYSMSSDNNLYYGTAIYIDGGTPDILFNNFKTRVSPRDAHSISENPVFLSTNGASPVFLHIDPSAPTGIESGAVFIDGYTTDVDGDTRDTSYPDIGADEGTFTGTDAIGPTISYTALSNTNTLDNPILNEVVITDMAGVNVTSGLKPRLYFKKSTDANTLAGWKFVETADTESPFSFTINYSLLNAGSATFGETIQYFVVAQDNAVPTVSINSGNFPIAPSSVALAAPQFPIAGTINSYQILPNLSGIKTVCPSGCDYSNLTLTNGAFDMINKSTVNGDITLQIAGDLTSETGLVRLNEFTSPYTLTIKPVGSARIISGTSIQSILMLNAADNVTIDGSLGDDTNTVCPEVTATRDLTIINNSTSVNSAVIWLQSNQTTTNGATGNTIKNCNITGNGTTTTLFGIGSGAFSNISTTSLGASNHNNAFINNNIKKVQLGIYSQGVSYVNKNNGTIISQNLINGSDSTGDNVRLAGIFVGFENNITISNNTVTNVAGLTTAIGIACGSISPTSTSHNGNDVSNATITNNTIDRIRIANANFTAGIFVCNSANSTGTNLITNNAVSNTFSKGTEAGFGILVGGGMVSTEIYHNTINMSGTATGGTQPNFAVAIGGNNTTAVLKNNIFINTASNGSGIAIGNGSYAMGLLSLANITSNNNTFYTSGSDAKFVKIGQLNNSFGTDYATLTAYRTGTSKDMQSLNTNVVFTSPTDLRPLITDISNAPIAAAGTDLTATALTDIDCAERSTTPSLGFKEFYVCASLDGGVATATMPSQNTPVSIVSATGYTAGSTMLYQWQSSPEATFAVATDIGSLSAYANLSVGTFPTTMWYRLKVTCTNGGATAYSTATEVTMLPPGNSLNFDGINDVVTVTPPTPLTGTFTVEAWVKPTHPTKNMSIFSTRRNGELSFDIQILSGNQIHGDIGNGATWLTTNANGTYNYKAGTWMHIAYAVSPSGYTIYANGQVVGSGTYSGTPLLFDANHYLELGAHTSYPTYFEGGIDEIKVYKSLRSQAEIQADMVSTATNDPTNRVLYYNFDTGIADSNNTGLTTLLDKSGNNVNANLMNFDLTGSTSNWGESYAMVLPVILPATNITSSGFTANWNAPTTGIVENYLLDVSTSTSFSSFVSGYQALSVSGTSHTLSGITPGIYYYRVRANKASVNTQGAYSAVSGEVELPYVAPGNALQFDGTDVLTFAGADLGNFGTGEFTIEFNIRTTPTFSSILNKRDLCGHQSFWDIGIFEGKLQIEIDQDAAATNYIAKHGNIIVNDNLWHHVAVTRNAAGLLSLYVDGILDVTATTPGITNISSSALVQLGGNICGGGFPGSIDELRIWTVARTQSQIQASRLNVISLPQTGLSAYYHFDIGTAGGNNAGVTNLKDYSGNHNGTLSNFNLSGATSNWIESYAMVVPTIATASTVPNGFTANWTAPVVGIVENYLLDVSTSATFSSFIPGYQALPVSGNSQFVSGLDGGNYYYRVRANKSSVNNQGAYSAISGAVQVPLTPPGHALQFDGTNDYVSYSNPTNIPVGNSPYTMEAWIYPIAMGNRGIIGWGNYGTQHQVNALRLSGNGLVHYWWGNDLTVTTGNLTGGWHHVAATFDGTTRKIILDGVVIAQDTPSSHNVPNANNLTIGTTNNQSEFFRGKIDETRIWNVALTEAQIKANMSAPIDSASPGLVLYNNFDKGSLVNSNVAVTTLPDQSSNGLTGTLQNFTLTIPTSNWVESYAMVAPVVAPATAVGQFEFTANWSAPITGTANEYLLDVSTTNTFASYVPGYQALPVSGTSQEVTGLTGGTYYYRVYALKTELVERSASSSSQEVEISATTTWNGSSWSHGVPDATMYAIIAGTYSSSGDLEAFTLTVNNNATVTVNSGDNFSIGGSLVVESGSVTFENNANLMQTEDVANTGNITIKRDAIMRRLDYVYWGSPVTGQELLAFSPETIANRFYTHNEASNNFVVIPDPSATDFIAPQGYMVRAPNTFPPNGSLATFHGLFSGNPNNGDYSIPVTNSGAGKGFNLLGNPYPSPISADLFLAQNPGTLYFWTHFSQAASSGNNYASYTNMGVTAAAGGETPNGFIQVGQGFMLKKASNGTATFTNTMRENNNDGQFFRNAASVEKHRIWLNLSNASVPLLNQILVGYMNGATEGFDDAIDGPLNYNGSSISSNINDESYGIQGRSLPFEATDVVPLNFKAETDGDYTIALNHVDGLFAEDQAIFIKDNLTGITHDIKSSAYTFATMAGTFNDRFEVVYQSAPLGIETPTLEANSVVIYKQNEALHINAGATIMQSVKVFDIRGRLVYEINDINTTSVSITDIRAEQQMLLVQITSDKNEVVTKKVVY